MDDKTLCELIASLKPDISWVKDIKVPTPDEIRARVAKLSPKERLAIEAEIRRIEKDSQK